MSNQEQINQLNNWLQDYCEGNYDIDNAEEHFQNWKKIDLPQALQSKNAVVYENSSLDRKVVIINGEIRGFLADKKFAFYIQESNEDYQMMNEDVKCTLAITDLEYFQESGALNDWHISESVYIPEYLDEVAEGHFYSPENLEQTKKDLLALGFIEDAEFNNFISSRM